MALNSSERLDVRLKLRFGQKPEEIVSSIVLRRAHSELFKEIEYLERDIILEDEEDRISEVKEK